MLPGTEHNSLRDNVTSLHLNQRTGLPVKESKEKLLTSGYTARYNKAKAKCSHHRRLDNAGQKGKVEYPTSRSPEQVGTSKVTLRNK